MVTIKQMAEMLGVSTTTISNVIHGKTKEVSKETVKRVNELIEACEYVPNINARNLAQNKSKIIGLAIKPRQSKYKKTTKDIFINELTSDIEDYVRKNGYYMMLYISEDIYEIINSVSSWNVDGLILMGMSTDDCIMLKQKFKKPMVFIDSYFDNRVVDYVNVGLDYVGGCHDITKYLIENGHKKIAYIADNCEGCDKYRYLGFRNALIESKIMISDQNFILIQSERNKLGASLEDIFNASKHFTALVCASDYYAVLIMNYLMDKGVKIPEDISIVGFDDNIYAQIVRPHLSTVHQDISEKSKVAVEKLFKMIENESLSEKNTILPATIVIRNSVKKIAGK